MSQEQCFQHTQPEIKTKTNNSPFSRHCLNMTYTQCFSLNKVSQVFTQQRLQDGKDSMMMLPSTGNLAGLACTTGCQIPSLKLTATATPPTKIDGWKEDDFFGVAFRECIFYNLRRHPWHSKDLVQMEFVHRKNCFHDTQ